MNRRTFPFVMVLIAALLGSTAAVADLQKIKVGGEIRIRGLHYTGEWFDFGEFAIIQQLSKLQEFRIATSLARGREAALLLLIDPLEIANNRGVAGAQPSQVAPSDPDFQRFPLVQWELIQRNRQL